MADSLPEGPGFGLALLLCALGVTVILTSCAVVEPPPGGPVDITPPYLAAMEPDSGATGMAGLKKIRLTFSEKMDRTSAATWLYFFPDQRIRKTSWSGATEAEVELEEGLPADTVVVIEVAGGMRDAHKVKNNTSRRFPISTGGVIPSGQIRGVLIMGDSAVTRGVVELYDTGPDSVEYFRRPLLRRTVTDETGTFLFDWLPVPGGPWLMRAFVDSDDNLRPGERDPQRLIPDTLSLTEAVPSVAAGVTTLYGLNTPGRLVTGAFTPFDHPGDVRAWTMAITENDTGWVPVPGRASTVYSTLIPSEGGTVEEVKPGPNRMVLFSDVDGDSIFSAIPDSVLGLAPAPDDSLWTGWWLEPWVMLEGMEVEPGLAARFTIPDTSTTLTPWPEPAPDTLAATADTLAALSDSLSAMPDSLDVPEDIEEEEEEEEEE